MLAFFLGSIPAHIYRTLNMNEKRTPLDVSNFEIPEELSQPATVPSHGQVVSDGVNTATRVVKDADVERMRTVAQLINVFNRAILDQSGREEWKASDVRAFFIALSVVDDIGISTPTNYE